MTYLVNKDNYQISSLEMTVTVMSTILGVGILTLPRSLAKSVGTPDGWISILIGLIFNLVLVTLIIKLNQKINGKNIIHYIRETNKASFFIAKLLSMLFICYFTFILAFEARIVTEVIGIYLINQTPSEVAIILMYMATTYAVTKGMQGIIHLKLLLFPIVLFVLLIIIMFNFREFDYKSLLPVGAEGITPIISGTKETIFSFLGIEILFFFLANANNRKISPKGINIGLLLLSLLYISSTILAFSILGIETTKVITFPFVELTKEIEIIQGLIERLEPLIITVWIMTIFNTMSVFHFIATKILKEEFLSKMRGSSIAISVAIISFMITFIPNSIQEAFSFGGFIGYFGLGLTLFTIVIGFLYVFRSKSRDVKQSEVS